MSFVTPIYTKADVNRAGEVLSKNQDATLDQLLEASEVLANWRGCHAYPINTFQATLRSKLKQIDNEALVAQRLKRTPSIIAKLQRFEGMQLARMQDIGGLRAVVGSMSQLRKLVENYTNSRFRHERLKPKDYIDSPKNDGYRSIHLIFRYHNDRVPVYDGLSLELQIRTKVQHAWATAVETMGTYLGQALKSGQGETEWRDFFRTASASLTFLERTSPVPGFEKLERRDVYLQVAKLEQKLNVLNKLRGFAIATDQIHTQRGTGAYHLIILNSENRSVTLKPFPMTKLDDANREYAEVESKAKKGQPLEAVLVSAGPVDALKKAYPNYFLDTEVFIEQMGRIIAASKR